MSDELQIPDSITPFEGYKAFNLVFDSDRDNPPIALASPQQSEPLWPAHAPLTAICRRTRIHNSLAPVDECSCGIYAVNDPAYAAGYGCVLAKVELFGRVRVGSMGYRGQFARILELFADVPELAARYRLDHDHLVYELLEYAPLASLPAPISAMGRDARFWTGGWVQLTTPGGYQKVTPTTSNSYTATYHTLQQTYSSVMKKHGV